MMQSDCPILPEVTPLMSQPFLISLLQQREIEARIVGPLFRAFAAEIGDERAREILASVVKQLAREGGCATAQSLGGNSMSHLTQAVENWRKGDALSLTVIRSDDTVLEFDVTRCKFAEMYRALGLEDIGAILSCNRDAAMVEGFNPEIELFRPKTLMMDHPCCDFRYRMNFKNFSDST